MDKLGMKEKYFLSITLVCLFSLIIVSSISYFISFRLVLSSTTSKIEMASQRYSNEINLWLEGQVDDLTNIKEDVAVNSPYYDDEHLEDMLSQKLRISEGQVLDYYIGFNDKRFLSGTGWIPTEGYDCTKRSWFVEAKSGKDVVYTLPYVDSDSKKMIITISEPLVMNNNVVGVLAVDITVDYLVELVNEVEITEGSYAFLVDSQKNIITYPEKNFLPTESRSYRIDKVMAGRFGELSKQIDDNAYSLTKLKDYDNEEKYFLLSEIESSKWILGFSIPTSEITNSLESLLAGFAVACVLSIMITMVVIFFLLNGMLKPVMHLTRVVKQFGDKKMEARCQITSNDEIGELGRTFNNMADTIQDYSVTLENKVEERTKEVKEKNAKIHDSIEYAKMIQQTILPEKADLDKALKDYFIIWKPRDVVGGDFYWMRSIDDGFVIVVGDCTGHGVPGALMTMAVNSILDHIIGDICHDNPAFIISELNRLLNKSLRRENSGTNIQDGLDVGIACASNTGEMLYSGAHVPMFIIKNGESFEIKGFNYTIGSEPIISEKYLTNHKIKLESGMSIYLATDGIKDQVGGQRGIPFGKNRLLEVLKSSQQCSMDEQRDLVLAAYENYMGSETPRDDITLFGFRL